MVDRQRMAAPGPGADARRRHHPGGGRHPQDGGARGGARSRGCCRSPTRRGGRSSRSPRSCSPPTAAAPTATPASPPTPRSAGRWTSWCATAARACSRRRPEIYGAEHLLIRRAVNEGVAKKLIDRYKWWEWYCRGIEEMDNNPAPGNKAGGITTVFEKSLGGVTKGGTTPMMDVFLYGEPITTRGFVFMDTPGPRPGVHHRPRGRRLQRHLLHHRPRLGVRLQAGALASSWRRTRHVPPHGGGHGHQLRRDPRGHAAGEVGRQIFEEIVAVASGKKTKSELAGVGEEEFAPWIIGPGDVVVLRGGSRPG